MKKIIEKLTALFSNRVILRCQGFEMKAVKSTFRSLITEILKRLQTCPMSYDVRCPPAGRDVETILSEVVIITSLFG